MIEINAVLYSYKHPNLLDVAKKLLDLTDIAIHISILDQHPLTRKQKFDELYNIDYQHQFWDKIDSPTWFKEEKIFDDKLPAEYTLLISDDILVTPGWVDRCIEFLNGNKNVLISGQGNRKAVKTDKHFISVDQGESTNLFSLTHLADRNFIFGYTETFRMTGYPTRDVKYYGEEEIFSIKCIERGISIYSAPSDLYEDLNLRTVESLYCPFSLEHNYNSIFELLESDAGKLWLQKINIEEAPIPLIYQNDDVLYDPYKLKFVEFGGERFIGNTKAIY